jgi:hypothetical protein
MNHHPKQIRFSLEVDFVNYTEQAMAGNLISVYDCSLAAYTFEFVLHKHELNRKNGPIGAY